MEMNGKAGEPVAGCASNEDCQACQQVRLLEQMESTAMNGEGVLPPIAMGAVMESNGCQFLGP